MRKSKAKKLSKSDWVSACRDLLIQDERSGVEDLKYYSNSTSNEIVEIDFKGGSSIKVDVTANSKGYILKAITNAVYGRW